MGWQFRKSKGVGPLRFSLSKKGVSTSIGGKGFRVTKRADGKIQRTVSIPGTGIRHTETISKKEESETAIHNYSPKNFKVASIILRVVSVLLILMGLLLFLVSPVIGVIAIILGIALFYMGNLYKKITNKNKGTD